MSIENIYATLEKLEKMHKSLLELAYKKTEILKENNMEALDLMLKNEQAHVAAIDQLEQQRQLQVTQYLRATGQVPTDKISVADVIKIAENEADQHKLQDVRNRLLTVIEDLRKQNDLNQKLTFQSLQFVNLSLDLLRPQPSQINYSGNEVRGTSSMAKKTYFDSQA